MKPRPDRADDRPAKGPGRKTKLLEIVVLGRHPAGQECPEVKASLPCPHERKLTVGDLICERVQMGATKKAAIGSAGCAEKQLYEWVARGQRDLKSGRKTPYGDFADRFARAEEHLEVGCVAEIRAAARHPQRPDWRADAWLLERRFPQVWGPPEQRVQHMGADGEPLIPKLLAERAILEAAETIRMRNDHARKVVVTGGNGEGADPKEV